MLGQAGATFSMACENETAHSENLKFGYLNVCGLKQRLEYPEFIEFIENYDIICLAETHSDQCDIIEINNYTYISKPRSKEFRRKSGGIGVLIKNKFAKYIDVIPGNSEYVL